MSEPEDKVEDEVPEGMVRKTRRVRKKKKQSRSSEEGKNDADTLFSKAKDLLVGMEDQDNDYGPVNVAEQVRRLKNKNKDDDRALDDVWGTKKRSSTWLWIVLAGLIFSVVAIVLAVTVWMKDEPASLGANVLDSEVGQIEEVDLSEGPLGWFDENSIEVLEQVHEIISRVNTAEGSEGIVKDLRKTAHRELNPIDLEKWGSPLLTNPTSGFQWKPKVANSAEGMGGDPFGYLQLNGTREDGNPFEIYFVNQGGRVFLDWEASLGWSEMPLAEMIEKKPRKETLLRCRVSKKPSFDQMFGQVAHSGYLLSGEMTDQFFLAYIPLDSDRGKSTDRDLKLMLHYGSAVTDKPPLVDEKVTVRVRYGIDSGPSAIFEIVEFVHDGWVTP